MINRTSSHRRILRLTILCAGLGFALKALLLSPIYVRLATDIAYANAWWLDILYFLTDGGLIDLIVFAICYPATLYAIRFDGLRASLRIPLAFSAITLLKFVANFFVDSAFEGALPALNRFLADDFPLILTMFLLELFQYIWVILIALLVRRLYEGRIRVAEGMSLLPRDKRVIYPLPPRDFPFVTIYARRNALQRGALLTAIMMTVGRVLMHLIYQIAQFTQFGSSEGWQIMLIDLIGDIVIGVIFYFVSLLIMMSLHQKESNSESK